MNPICSDVRSGVKRVMGKVEAMIAEGADDTAMNGKVGAVKKLSEKTRQTLRDGQLGDEHLAFTRVLLQGGANFLVTKPR